MQRTLRSSFAFLLLLGVRCLAQVPNGGFENWTDQGTYSDPDNWATFNSLTAGLGVVTCEQEMPGAVGTSCVKVTTRTIIGLGVLPGAIFSGTDIQGSQGFPYAERSAALTGQYKYAIADGDQGLVTVTLSHWNSSTQTRDQIGGGELPITGSQAGWTNFSIPIEYVSPDDPDTAAIYIFSSANAGVDGSTISVDDLAFSGTATGVSETAAQAFQLYPMPAADVLHIQAAVPVLATSVVDLRGRELRTVTSEPTTIDVAGLATGTYLLRVRFTNGRVATRTFVKN